MTTAFVFLFANSQQAHISMREASFLERTYSILLMRIGHSETLNQLGPMTWDVLRP